MTRFIKATKDNQDLYFHTFLDCLIYFEQVKEYKDSKYQTLYSAFYRAKFKKQFDFATIERCFFTFL